MSSSSVRTDKSLLSRIDVGVHKVESALNLIAGITILALVLLTVVNIFGNLLFKTPVFGYIDLLEQAMAIIGFLGIAYCHRLGGHIRMDILIGKFQGRSLWFIEIINTILISIVTTAIIYGSFLHFQRSVNGTFSENIEILITKGIAAFFSHSSLDSSTDLYLPIWPAKLIIPIAFSLLLLRLLLHLWGYTVAFVQNKTYPIAVPTIEDTADQALKETASLGNIKMRNEND